MGFLTIKQAVVCDRPRCEKVEDVYLNETDPKPRQLPPGWIIFNNSAGGPTIFCRACLEDFFENWWDKKEVK